MLWETINSLKKGALPQRAAELRLRLEGFDDHDLVVFHEESLATFRALFTPQIYRLYCIVFDGETNGSGLTDFCSNLILSGRLLVDAVLFNPDNFSSVTNTVPFNDDSGLSVTSIAWHILVKRHDECIVEGMFRGRCVDWIDGIWEELENQMGSLNFEPDWHLAKSTLPRIYERIQGSS